jgi:hypothetical protein
MMQAGIDLLPEWAARLHGFIRPEIGKPVLRLGALGVGRLMQWALH